MLRCVWAHLEPQHAVGLGNCAVAKDYVAVVQTLATECQTAVNPAVGTVLYDDIITRTIVWVFVCPCALAAFQHHCIVAHAHVTAIDKHVVAHVDVDSIRTWCATFRIYWSNTAVWRKDIATEIAYILRLIDMIGPERAVDKVNILYCHIIMLQSQYKSPKSQNPQKNIIMLQSQY